MKAYFCCRYTETVGMQEGTWLYELIFLIFMKSPLNTRKPRQLEQIPVFLNSLIWSINLVVTMNVGAYRLCKELLLSETSQPRRVIWYVT